ncbi:MAG: MotE family protein [Fibrobacterota bacterium]
MNKTEIGIISIFMILFSFPLVYLALLIGTGNAKIVFEGDLAQKIEVENQARLQRESTKRDSLIEKSTLAFEANKETLEEIEEEREKLISEQRRLENLKKEIEQEKSGLNETKAEIESLIGETEESREGQLRKLAEVYETMDNEAAARILETLSDELCIRIFTQMGEPRQQAGILAAMEGEKASRITRKMGQNE